MKIKNEATKLFSDLYLSKLSTSAKPCRKIYCKRKMLPCTMYARIYCLINQQLFPNFTNFENVL